MKKILSLILVLATMLSFAACTKETANEEPETKPESEQIVDTEEDVQEEVIPEEENLSNESKYEWKLNLNRAFNVLNQSLSKV